MSITRKMLKGMGLTEEQADTIIEAHNETVTGLVADRDKYKADAEKLPDIQKKLDEWEKSGYKQKYEDKVKEYNQLVADNTAKATKAAKEKAVRAYFESKNIMGSNLDLAMRGCGEEGYSHAAVVREIKWLGLTFKMEISKKTIYNYIDKVIFYGIRRESLPEHGERKRKYDRVERKNAAHAPQGESMEECQQEINDRQTFGHWESASQTSKYCPHIILVILLHQTDVSS
jgi:hypothetical protein